MKISSFFIKNINQFWYFIFVLVFLFQGSIFSAGAQEKNAIRGIVSDEYDIPIPGALVVIKGTTQNAVTNEQGNFSISTDQKLPLTVIASFVGLTTQEVVVYENQAFNITLTQSLNKLDELVVTASKKEESLSKVPITVETLSSSQLKQIPTASVYDAISTLKGVNTLNSSITFTVYNTRGFQDPTNLRFVQLVDGADNASPELGLPVANTIGPGELDVQSVELIPGASSALYGLNASNGLLNLITKDPFTYQGLSVSLKSGANNVNSPFKNKYKVDASPYNNIALRYAKALNDKFAFKVNLGYLKGQDWTSGDTNNYRDWNGFGMNKLYDPGYDGANIYGDDGGATNLQTLGGKPTYVSRTGYAESELTDYEVKLLHADATLVYKFNEKTKLSYTYRTGKVDNVFTRSNKLKLKDFLVQQHVLDFKSSNFTFRTYYNTEDAGDSYNIRFLADALNTSVKPSAQWNADFVAGFNAAFTGDESGREAAFQAARAAADNNRLIPGTLAFNQMAAEKKNDGDWTTGSKYIARGYLWHSEATYDFSPFTHDIADVLVGADYRYSRAESDGTFYPDTVGGDPVYLDKLGAFLQAGRDLTPKLRLVASVRGDKARALGWSLTERIGLIYSPNKRNNFRLSYQNGYRQPTFFEAAAYAKSGTGIGVGGLKPISEPVNIVGNSYTYPSVTKFVDAFKEDATKTIAATVPGLVPGIITSWVTSGQIPVADAQKPETIQRATTEAIAQATQGAYAQAFASTGSLLEVSDIDYLKPEQNQTIDFNYKGSFLRDKLYVDLNVYGTKYNNFIQTFTVVKPTGGVTNALTDAQKIVTNQFVGYQTKSNVSGAVYVYGASLGVDYNFFKKYVVSGNFNYITLDWGDTSEAALSNGFNTPEFNFNLSVANPNAYKNIGFKVLYKWTAETKWSTDFSRGEVPFFQTVDAQVSYRIPKYFVTLALGGTNLFNKYYTQFVGGPSIGGFYYGSIVFDGLLTR
ncbi:putative iron-regulated outer membrane virulence protein [Bacteroidales bacterium Barb7]|nr:putative iron-regulated outer membrane virulence protein [Bacteroidales bacterium Barb7]